jgi:hypothetical protein
MATTVLGLCQDRLSLYPVAGFTSSQEQGSGRGSLVFLYPTLLDLPPDLKESLIKGQQGSLQEKMDAL